MEKYIVFGPIIVFFGFFALVIIGFLLLVVKLLFNAKDQAWVGEVINKSDFIKHKDDSNLKEHVLSLKVKMDNGEIHTIPASPRFFNEINVGDKLKKEKGTLWPKKIN